uniref:WAP domain-containing protein n=1 Tax=Varanus komodoensis TaxID=61221 RepID=A0A8D2L7Y5_VARKO
NLIYSFDTKSLWFTFLWSHFFTTEKAKSCPVDTTECPNILKKDCKNDSDCPGTQKCCFSKCILTCVNPS